MWDKALTYPTLREMILERENSLNFVRLILASGVIISHTPYIVLGREAVPADPFLQHLYVFGDYAVNGFFCISGFLIAHSATRSGLGSYLVKRIARIFPAWWVSVLFVIFAGGAIAERTGHLPAGWTWSGALHYWQQNYDLVDSTFSLMGGPVNVPYEKVWNGSQWSLEFEWFAYLFLIPLMYTPLFRKYLKITSLTVYLAITIFYLVGLNYPEFIYDSFGWSMRWFYVNSLMYSLFFAGTVLYAYSDRIRCIPLVGYGSVALGLVITWAAYWKIGIQDWTHLLVAYGVLCIGASTLMNVPIGRKNDISYGIYIYAWPVQQILVMLGSVSLGWALNIALDFVITVALAWVSWKCIEKPALNYVRHPMIQGKVEEKNRGGNDTSNEHHHARV